MARSSNQRFHAEGRLAPDQHERTLFDRVCDAVGATAAYVAHDVMGDIHSKLIDEGWFGRAPTGTPASPSVQSPPAASARPTTLTIDGEFTRSYEQGQSHDLDR